MINIVFNINKQLITVLLGSEKSILKIPIARIIAIKL